MGRCLNGKATELGDANFTYVWLPPSSRASFGACSNGYDPQDLYDLGEYGGGPTGLGTRAEVDALIAALDANGINSVADVIFNHRDGGDWETNSAVRDYVINYPNCGGSATPYPLNGKVRYILPLGGMSGNTAGDYFLNLVQLQEMQVLIQGIIKSILKPKLLVGKIWLTKMK